MGNKHPLSLGLKRNINWSSIIYKYNNINKEKNKERIINEIILQKYKERLISKPVYEHLSEKIKVIITEYKRVREEKKEIKKIENKIKKRINKDIEINKIEIKKPILDSKILGEYIKKRMKKNSIQRIRKEIKREIKIPKMREEEEYSYNWLKIKENYINKEIKSYIKGIYIIVKGRISKKRRAQRSMKYRINIGRLEFNKINNMMDYSQIKINGINGVYNIKIGIKTDIV
nr:ribosomal protein S3 [Neoconidiobolus thromboides]